MRTTRTAAVTILLLVQVSNAFAGQSGAESVSWEKFSALEARVEKLESLLAGLQSGVEGELAATMSSMPEEKHSSKNTLLDNVVQLIQFREDSVNHPWMDPALWQDLELGMSPETVVALLGEPTLDEPSLSKRVDAVYTYKGKQTSTGNRFKGILRFYRNKLIEVEAPAFAE